MQSPPLQVHLVLRARPPAPARLSLAYQRARWRALHAVGALLAGAGAAWLASVWPGGPWAAVAMAAGIPVAAHLWRARHRVRSFTGLCPACGGSLHLRLGAPARLPMPVPCRRCGASPELRLRPPSPVTPAPSGTLRHDVPDCTGEWGSEWLWDECTLACRSCGARHAGTAELRRLAGEENQRGDLLARLAEEGRFL
jgi:hypothetical protein